MVGATADVVNDADDEAINAIDTKGEQGRKRKGGCKAFGKKKKNTELGKVSFMSCVEHENLGFKVGPGYTRNKRFSQPHSTTTICTRRSHFQKQ